MQSKKEKLIHNIASKYISGKEIDIELEGNTHELKCLLNLLESSKKLYMMLNDDHSTLEEINKVLQEKKQITQDFESLTGIIWRL